MICFHFTIFVVLTTTITRSVAKIRRLWFAFILLSLSYWQQPMTRFCDCWPRCDLLSFYYLCRTDNNVKGWDKSPEPVVICFHFTIFVVLTTTQNGYKDFHHSVVICFHFTIFVVLTTTSRSWVQPKDALWFAFILLSLSYWQQQNLYYFLNFSMLTEMLEQKKCCFW